MADNKSVSRYTANQGADRGDRVAPQSHTTTGQAGFQGQSNHGHAPASHWSGESVAGDPRYAQAERTQDEYATTETGDDPRGAWQGEWTSRGNTCGYDHRPGHTTQSSAGGRSLTYGNHGDYNASNQPVVVPPSVNQYGQQFAGQGGHHNHKHHFATRGTLGDSRTARIESHLEELERMVSGDSSLQ
ncbi:hypothetical protein I302_105444 [Kwoniella bestiolae CBS 10118]|uniref:Uncharacterized protein n=1 Tax=Kwoniella bestiolae CBS 10118 TaxID=1296100 RepID=A0A1B9FT49_9TREE|nr:hypothetical protein I302_08725 [Kwoniella bestiolae CBS 10118]OCF21945.1 hypothetical protein I302_08725 [Kwoniella bestiolae CBS 10118]